MARPRLRPRRLRRVLQPRELSAGMRRWVSLARVLLNEPRILPLDEPFVAVDGQTPFILQRQLASIWLRSRQTVFFVTHSIEEAVRLAARVVVMTARTGRVEGRIEVPLQRPQGPTSPALNDIHRRAVRASEGEAARAFGGCAPDPARRA